MTDDIVTRLREHASEGIWDFTKCSWDIQEAADEIERWQDIARRLYLLIQDPCTHNHWCDVCSSIDAYEKAVRLAGNNLEDVANEIEEMHYLARNLILSLTDMAERNMLQQVTIGFRDALDALSERVSR